MRGDAPRLEEFPVKATDKLRYADTDRQGHVNNAVFATFLETGRVEILHAAENPLAGEGCAFVIASLELNFLSEINWPGTVEIGSRVAGIGNSSLTLEQGIFQNGQCVATARTVIVQMDEATRKSKALSARAVERLSAIAAIKLA